MNNNKQNNKEEKNGLAAVLVFFLGFIAGTAISLLYTPNSGTKTREKIRKTSTDVKNQTEEFVQQTIKAVKEGFQPLDTRQDADAACEDEDTEAT